LRTINLLDLVPSFKRHLRQYVREDDTDSTLAAYLADGIVALSWRWTRTYVISTVSPNTYSVAPDLVTKDYRPVILMAAIIYKTGTTSLASYRDGDFAFDPVQGRINPISLDIAELDKMLPMSTKLAQGITAPMFGYAAVYSPETYNFFIR
jgi:hypothetical protein